MVCPQSDACRLALSATAAPCSLDADVLPRPQSERGASYLSAASDGFGTGGPKAEVHQTSYLRSLSGRSPQCGTNLRPFSSSPTSESRSPSCRPVHIGNPTPEHRQIPNANLWNADTVLPDSNCLSYCQAPILPGWTPAGGEVIRRNLFGALGRDELVVIGSQFHLEEASRISVHRASWVKFFWDVVKWNVLLATIDLVVLEAKHGRVLQGNEPYDEYHRRQRMRDKTLRWPDLDSLASKVARFAADSGDLYKDLRDSTLSAILPQGSRARLQRRFPRRGGRTLPTTSRTGC